MRARSCAWVRKTREAVSCFCFCDLLLTICFASRVYVRLHMIWRARQESNPISTEFSVKPAKTRGFTESMTNLFSRTLHAWLDLDDFCATDIFRWTTGFMFLIKLAEITLGLIFTNRPPTRLKTVIPALFMVLDGAKWTRPKTVHLCSPYQKLPTFPLLTPT